MYYIHSVKCIIFKGCFTAWPWPVEGKWQIFNEGEARSSFENRDKTLVPYKRDRISSWGKNLGLEQITSQQGLILQQGVNL